MLRDELARFGAARARTLALAEGRSQAELDFAPGPGRWSVGEVLDHLLRAERFFRGEVRQMLALRRAGQPPFLRRSMAEFNISLTFVPRWLVPWLDVPFTFFGVFVPRPVREFLLRSRAVPARHPDVATPRRGRPAGELLAELRSSWQETEALFRAATEEDFAALRYFHPLLGINTAADLLRTLALHEERHHGQIADVLRALPRSPMAAWPLRLSP
jgi:uncharacterized damage-inducible protein DinB